MNWVNKGKGEGLIMKKSYRILLRVLVAMVFLVYRIVIFNTVVWEHVYRTGELETETFKNIFTNGTIGQLTSPITFFPTLFLLEAFLVVWPLKRGSRVLYVLQGLFMIFMCALYEIDLSLTSDWSNYQIHKYDNGNLVYAELYIMQVFFFALWSIIVATPLAEKYTFFNWPFVRGESTSS